MSICYVLDIVLGLTYIKGEHGQGNREANAQL